MKTMKLTFVALAMVVASQAAGCIFVSDDDDEPGPPTQGVLHATWSLTLNAAPTTCGDVGADTVSILSTDSQGNGKDDLFDCVDLAGDTAPLALDSYTVAIDILDAQGNSLAAQPAVVDADFTPLVCDNISTDGATCFINLPNVEFAFTN